MTTDIKELVKRLRDGWSGSLRHAAADALEAMAGEVERLTVNGIHTCHDNCQRFPCVQGRKIRRLEAENARLKGALAVIASDPTHSGQAMIARKALAGETT